MQKGNETKKEGSKTVPQSSEARLTSIAERSLRHFEETVTAARLELGEPRPLASNAFAVLNSLTNEPAIRNFERLSQNQIKELRQLCIEPAIARIVAKDDSGATRVYYISRATPHRSPSDGMAASYRAPVGRLASLPIGGDLEIPGKNRIRTLTVLERALLRPSERGAEWDSLNSVVQGEAFGPFTISSFRQLLLKSGIPADAVDDLEAALAEDRAEAVVVEGLRRDAITKMELRDLSVLDEFQDTIFRLPLDTHLILLGPPGTGKTTTLIKRLGLKLDQQHLSEDERDIVAATTAGSARHAESWMMFTPTSLLKQYIKEAFARENIPAPDDRIQTWDDFRRDVARNRFGILRSTSGSGQFVSKDDLPSLEAATLSEQTQWCEDFETWHLNSFWDDLRTHADTLAADGSPEIARLGKRLLNALPSQTPGLHANAFPEMATLTEPLQAAIARLKETTDKAIRDIVAQEHRNDTGFLDRLAALIATLSEGDDADDLEVEDEDEVRQIRIGRDAAVEALSRALRAKARSIASGRTLSKQTRSGKLVDWFGERGPSRDALRALGVSLQVQASARRFVNPVRRLINGLPSRYRRFRRERQAEGRWYSAEGFAATDLNPLEVDVILLATLKAGRGLLLDRRIAREIEQGGYSNLMAVRALYRTQVLVDEATDFSPIQLSCMSCFCDPASGSFIACGDFNQRITEWGSRSTNDLNWVFSDFDVRSVSITYRHSRQLNELARSIALLSSPDVPEAQLPQRVNNDGFEPILAVGLKGHAALADWLSQRIAEIERLTDTLPPVAVLVADESEVQPMAKALDAVLAGGNIRAVPCPFGQLAGQDNDVRVFDVRHIKGLEFEAVFFTSIDRLAELQPDLFEKYLYVGATRAAMYLGLTTEGASLPSKVASLQNRFKSKWP